MNAKKITLIFRIAIIAIGICGLLICALWYPFSISLTTMGTSNATPTAEQSVRIWVQLVFYWVVSVPCFLILVFTWKVSSALKKEELFSKKIVRLINLEISTLLIDLLVFLIGNIVFILLKWNDFAIVYFMITIIGLVVVSFFWIALYVIKRGIEMQEEIEGTI